VDINGSVSSFRRAHITRIVLHGQAGNDSLIASRSFDFPLDVFMNGGPGNDELSGALGNDRLNGGRGDDHIWGGGGDDTLIGAQGTGSPQTPALT
jgi:Ca2+-binding RTX toxin-like protein